MAQGVIKTINQGIPPAVSNPASGTLGDDKNTYPFKVKMLSWLAKEGDPVTYNLDPKDNVIDIERDPK